MLVALCYCRCVLYSGQMEIHNDKNNNDNTTMIKTTMTPLTRRRRWISDEQMKNNLEAGRKFPSGSAESELKKSLQ